MNQVTASVSTFELPKHIASAPLVDTIIDVHPVDEGVLVPRARIVFAKNSVKNPSYQSKRTSCRYLLHQLLNSISNLKEQSWNLDYSSTGAPALAGPDNHMLSISMARTGDWLAAGVSYAASLGIDLERIKPRKNFQQKAEFLNWKVPVDDNLDFHAKWTLWEASAKCVGGSVLMRNNQGFDKLSNVDTYRRFGCSAQWHGLHHTLDENTFYAIVLRCDTGVKLRHHILCLEEIQAWPFTIKSVLKTESRELNQCT